METPEKQFAQLAHNTEQILPAEDLKKKLSGRRTLTVKLGLDPTSPDIHLGHAVVLRKLRQFQDFGHKVVLIVGDFTAKIGDPSGRSKTRPVLSDAEITKNSATYKKQALKILDPNPKKLTVRFNSEWLSELKFDEVLRLLGTTTVSQVLAREDFRKRLDQNGTLGLHELVYPLMQAQDSVAINADVELGGTDQTFNLLAGRELQVALGKEPQVVMTMPLLIGTDGVMKMSKSIGNSIGISDKPDIMFGKVMSLPDPLLTEYLRLASTFDEKAVQAMLTGIKDGKNPMNVKKKLAANIVQQFWTDKDAKKAEAAFTATFSKKEFPQDAPMLTVTGSTSLLTLLTEIGHIFLSNSEARRKIAEGAIQLNGAKVKDPMMSINPKQNETLQLKVGKKGFYRVTRQYEGFSIE